MLRDRIAAGTYARGDKLPSEMELWHGRIGAVRAAP